MRRSAWRHARLRRVLAAVAAAGAVWTVLTVLRPPAPDLGPEVFVAVGDLPVGSILAPDDLTRVSAPAALVPAGSLVDPADAAGRTLAAPLRAGEVLTDADLSTAALAEGLEAGTLVAHVPLGNPPLAAAASPGTKVDVVSLLDGSTVAAEVLVLAPDVPGGSGLFVAVAADDAGRLARHGSPAALDGGVTVVLHPPAETPLP